MTTRSVIVCGLVLVAACRRPEKSLADAGAEARPRPRVNVTVLATSDETGASAPRVAEVWAANEGHCRDGGCLTLAVSTTGRAADRSEALEALGVVASSALAANLEVDGGAPGHVVVERGGVRFYVLGLRGVPSVDGGIDERNLIDTLQRDIVPAWRIAPVAVVVSDVCSDVLARILERHGNMWPFLVTVVGRACGPTPAPRHIFGMVLLAAPDDFTGYAKATLSLDQRTAALLRAEAATVPFASQTPR
ncbi:MAG: hypothetical protein JNG84_01340 [Archangium sp.]|nr:hypothetical protein [Archangium sp.]